MATDDVPRRHDRPGHGSGFPLRRASQQPVDPQIRPRRRRPERRNRPRDAHREPRLPPAGPRLGEILARGTDPDHYVVPRIAAKDQLRRARDTRRRLEALRPRF